MVAILFYSPILSHDQSNFSPTGLPLCSTLQIEVSKSFFFLSVFAISEPYFKHPRDLEGRKCPRELSRNQVQAPSRRGKSYSIFFFFFPSGARFETVHCFLDFNTFVQFERLLKSERDFLEFWVFILSKLLFESRVSKTITC